MDVHPTPFPGNKTQSVKSKYQKVTEPSKPKPKEAPVQRQKRVFGTTRNPNVPTKTVPPKPIPKPSQKQPKPISSVPVTEPVKKSPENNTRARLKKKIVSFPEKIGQNVAQNMREREIDEGLRTPVRSPALGTARLSGTPYRSAEKCSNCRFDRLETVSYWLGQIRLAESVGKHFVSVAFFQLASDSKAEPVRNLRIELKRYLARHEYLPAETEWQEVCRKYGISVKGDQIKDNEAVVDSGCGKSTSSEAILGDNIDDQEPQIEEKEQLKEISE